MPRGDLAGCVDVLKKYEYNGTRLVANDALSKLTVEGAGMQRQSGVAAKLFSALAEKNIGIFIITTSETEISFCVDTKKAKDAIGVVSEAFSL
ncbi:MAG: ACT domain-containing protein [Eubacteriales bacterium]|nr:ACT domain-containing protein [Eubacteriales bacterium]